MILDSLANAGVYYSLNRSFEQVFAFIRDTDLAGGEDFVDLYKAVGPSINLEHALGREDLFCLEGWLAMLVGRASNPANL